MLTSPRRFLSLRLEKFLRTPFGCLSRLFVVRMFHGGAEPGAEDLDLGLGAILILLAMPGLFVSLLMFEKYGSLIRFFAGVRVTDPLAGVFPDEYFFIVLSFVVTGAAALWRWNAIFPDARDYANLVALPVRLSHLFFANLLATTVFAVLLSVAANLASIVLFPAAVVGSQSSLSLVIHFALGHAASVILASIFSFLSVFALAALLMTLLPPSAFRRTSLVVRFVIAVWFVALLASCLAVPDWLASVSVENAHRLALLPPVSFLGIAQTIWGRGDPFVFLMARAALAAIASSALLAAVAYSLSFRRTFLRLPEYAGITPLPRRLFFSPLSPLTRIFLHSPAQQACYRFVARTLLRTENHQQVILGFLAIGLVISAQTLGAEHGLRSLLRAPVPPPSVLAVPFLLSYCLIAGTRLAFELPADLRANWIFRLWLAPHQPAARAVARSVLLAFSLGWLAPLVFLFTFYFSGWLIALLHTALWAACNLLLVEILLLRFRKIPCTCAYPPFQSHSGLLALAYLFGFVFFTGPLPDLERWILRSPIQLLWSVPLFAAAFAALRKYRSQMLDMDKSLIFEQESPGFF